MAEYIERETVKTAIREQFQDIADRIEILTIINLIPAADVVDHAMYKTVLDKMLSYADRLEEIARIARGG